MSACDRSNLFIAESLFAESCLRFASLLAAIDEIYVIETRLVSKNRILINGTTIQNRFILFNHFFNDIDISLVRIRFSKQRDEKFTLQDSSFIIGLYVTFHPNIRPLHGKGCRRCIRLRYI